MCSQPPQLLSHAQQPVQEYQAPYYTVYYLNGMPYACYTHQPDVLYPMQVIEPEKKDRLLPELVSAVADATGQVLQQHVASLENYVQNMEQQTVSKVDEKVKKSCLSCIM
jgi:hypothetical protein